MPPVNYTVGEVASLAHVSVRALHHYDAIGLLVPSGRTTGGYRSYSVQDVQRLQQILFYRALEFGLDDIAAMLADPGASADDHLRRQHRLLREQIDHRRDLLAAIEKEMEARAMGISLTPEEQFEIFGDDWPGDDYAVEAEERWGDTDAWKQSQSRTAALTKQDWLEIKAATEANESAFADAMRAGEPVDSAHVQELVEAHRAGVCRFWDCSPEAHKNLADMYLADDRFRKHYDDIAPGLAEYLHAAISAH
jgi:DNA-binding transcriptional MerR regulator